MICLCFALVACEQSHDPETLYAQGDYEAAYSLWKSRADEGDPSAQQKLGMMHYLGLGVPRDFKRAFLWYEKAALGGNVQAQWNLGSMYASGLGTGEDVILAYGWLHHADLNGNPHARQYLEFLGNKLTPNQTMKGKEIVAGLLHHPASDK